MKTKPIKTALLYLPEVSLLLLSIGAMIGGSFNYLAVAFFAVILTLIIWKNKYYAYVISILLSFSFLWMLLALISEYREFPQGNEPAAIQLLLVGSLMVLYLLAMAIILPIKYFHHKQITFDSAV